MAVNNSLLNLLAPTVTKGVDVQRSASPEHSPTDQPRFSDTLKTIEQSLVAERTKRAATKVQKNRDAQNDLQQKAIDQKRIDQKRTEQKSKLNISAQNSVKNSEAHPVRGEKRENTLVTNRETKQIANESEDARATSNCDTADKEKAIGDESALNDGPLGAPNVVSQTKNESPNTSETSESLAQEVDSALSSNVEVGDLKNSEASSHQTLVGAVLNVSQELESDALHSELESKSQTHDPAELVGFQLSDSLNKEQAIKKGKDQLQPSQDEFVSDQNVEFLDGAAQYAGLADIKPGAQMNTPIAQLAETLKGSVDKAENALEEMIKMPTQISTNNSAQKLVNQAATSNNINGDATTRAAGLLSSDETEIFKSIIGEMKTGSSTPSDTMDLLSVNDLPAPDLNKSTASSGLLSGLQNALSSEASTRGFIVKAAVEVPVGQPTWSQAVGDKVLWLAAQNVTSAELHLHPEDLGPMQVKVSIGQDQVTQVNFTSHHAQVREILDQNLQRLKDMFAEQGMHSVQVDVSDRSSREQTQDQRPKFTQAAASDQEDEAVVAMSSIQIKRLVDHYA